MTACLRALVLGYETRSLFLFGCLGSEKTFKVAIGACQVCAFLVYSMYAWGYFEPGCKGLMMRAERHG